MIEHFMRKSLCALGLFGAAATSQAAEIWSTLPEKPIFAARVNFDSPKLKQLRSESAAGNEMFSEAKLAKLSSLLWNKMLEDEEAKSFLEEQGFTQQDMSKLFSGETGLCVYAKGENIKMQRTLFWFKTKEAFANKLVAAFEKVLKEEENEDMQVHDIDGLKTFLNIEGANATSFVHLGDGTFLFCHNEYTVKADPIDYRNVDFKDKEATKIFFEKREKQLEELRAKAGEIVAPACLEFVGETLNRIKSGDSESALTLRNHEGLRALISEKPIAEMLFDLDSIKSSIGPTEAASMTQFFGTEMPKGYLTLDFIDKHLSMRSQLLLGETARKNLAFLEQPTQKIAPPSWVPASAPAYSQISLDLVQTLERVRELARGLGAEAQFDMAMQQANAGLKQQFNANVSQILSSFGKTLYGVNFKHDIIKNPNGRAGMVLALKNSALVSKIFDMGTMLLTMQNSQEMAVSKITDDKFKGVDVHVQNPEKDMRLGLFSSDQHLAISVGENASSELIGLLKNPPKEEFSLAQNEAFNQLLENNELSHCLLFGYNSAKSMNYDMRKAIEAQIPAGLMDQDSSDTKLAKALLALLPSAEQMQKSFGAAFSIINYNDYGPTFEANIELK